MILLQQRGRERPERNEIKGTTDVFQVPTADAHVHHGGADPAVPHACLDDGDIGAGFEQMGGKAVSACFDIMLHLMDN